jgi:hypothetical protein
VIEEKLSEEGTTSDRFGCVWRKAVRRRCNFGQVQACKEKSCPKNRLLQTGLGVEVEKLSEERVTLTFLAHILLMDLLAYS